MKRKGKQVANMIRHITSILLLIPSNLHKSSTSSIQSIHLLIQMLITIKSTILINWLQFFRCM